MQQACNKTEQEQDTKVIHTSVDVEYIDNDAVEFSLSVCSRLLLFKLFSREGVRVYL